MTVYRDRKDQRRVHSINFDRRTDEWLESLVSRLAAIGYTRAGRSETVREALLDLREKLAGRSDFETLRFFVERTASRVLASAEQPPVVESCDE